MSDVGSPEVRERGLLARLKGAISPSRAQAIAGLVAAFLSIGDSVYGYLKVTRPSATGELVTLVRDRTDKPVADAMVEVLTGKDALVTSFTTAEATGARRTLKEGTYRLRVTHPKFAPDVERSTHAELLRRLQRWDEAPAQYRHALTLTARAAERRVLAQRLAELERAHRLSLYSASRRRIRGSSGGRTPMRLVIALAVAVVTVAACLPGPLAHAQDTKLEVRSTDTVKSVLERQVGKRVSLVLTTGPELGGVVTAVGDHSVHLSELSGREFFDAVVSLDRISAVVVRARGR